MTQLALEAKEAIVKKALSRSGQTLKEIAQENSIASSTLYKWLQLKRDGESLEGKRRGRFSGSNEQIAPLKHLLATANLDETAVGAYCRRQGIYSFQLKEWQDELMKENSDKKISVQSRDELKALRNENKLLKQDLRRKDKALAETSALLVLKKKADLIWGELADD